MTFPCREILDALSQLVFIKDPEGRFIFGNKAFLRFLGLSKLEGLVGRKDTDPAFKHTQKQIIDFQELDTKVVNGKSVDTPLEFATNAEGEAVALSTIKVPMKLHPDDALHCVVGIATIVESHAGFGGMLHRILNDAADGMYVKDTEGRYVMANQAMADFFGVKSSADVIGKTIEDLCPEYAEQAAEEDHRILRYGKKFRNRLRFRAMTDDNPSEVRLLQTNKAPLEDSTGRRVGIIGIVRDVTNMQTSVRNQAFRAFSFAAAHQLNNNLNALGTYFSSLQDKVANEDTAGTDALLGKMNFVLKECGKTMKPFSVPQPEGSDGTHTVNIRNFIEALLQTRATSDGIKLEIVSHGPSIAFVNKQLLSDSLQELYLNSTKQFTVGNVSDRRITITIDSEVPGQYTVHDEAITPLSYLRITFSDNGPGFAKGEAKKIFENGYSRNPGGWGYGLSMVKAAVTKMHGFIEARNRDEGGASFEIVLNAPDLHQAHWEHCSAGTPLEQLPLPV